MREGVGKKKRVTVGYCWAEGGRRWIEGARTNGKNKETHRRAVKINSEQGVTKEKENVLLKNTKTTKTNPSGSAAHRAHLCPSLPLFLPPLPPPVCNSLSTLLELLGGFTVSYQRNKDTLFISWFLLLNHPSLLFHFPLFSF